MWLLSAKKVYRFFDAFNRRETKYERYGIFSFPKIQETGKKTVSRLLVSAELFRRLQCGTTNGTVMGPRMIPQMGP